MEASSRFKYRFVRPDEAKRLAELVGDLQRHQQMKGVAKLPDERDIRRAIFHQNNRGEIVPHNLGTFTAVVVDSSRADDDNKSNLVGYLLYSLIFSLKHGRQFYINSFFIEEPYRRHGLGRKLIQFMQFHAEMLAIKRFDVPFMKSNHLGQKFYKTFGAYLVDDEYNLIAATIANTSDQ